MSASEDEKVRVSQTYTDENVRSGKPYENDIRSSGKPWRQSSSVAEVFLHQDRNWGKVTTF